MAALPDNKFLPDTPFSRQITPSKDAASLARQVSLFNALHRQRGGQYCRTLREVRELERRATEAEMELVYESDRADFFENQLRKLLESPQGSKVPDAVRFGHADFHKLERHTQAALAQSLELEDEISDRRERVAWVIARLRTLRPLCRLGEGLIGNDADRGIALLLQQCEEKLMVTYSNGAGATLEPLIADYLAASTVPAVIPLLQRQTAEDDAIADAQDQWLLPARRTPSAAAAAEEDLRLQREIEKVADRHEVLRQEFSEHASRRDVFEAEARRASDMEAEAAKESETWQRNTQRLVEETSELQSEVASMQAELPQLESQAATVRLQLGCERSTVAAHREEISRCRAAVPALAHQLRRLAPADGASRARQATIASLRRELASAYAALAAAQTPRQESTQASAALQRATSSGSDAERQSGSPNSPGDEKFLERKLEVARAVNMGLKAAVEARNDGQAKQTGESRQELTLRVARNSKEIADLKERLRREELHEVRIKRQESRATPPAVSPVSESRVTRPNSPPAGAQVFPTQSPTQSSRSSQIASSRGSSVQLSAQGASVQLSAQGTSMAPSAVIAVASEGKTPILTGATTTTAPAPRLATLPSRQIGRLPSNTVIANGGGDAEVRTSPRKAAFSSS